MKASVERKRKGESDDVVGGGGECYASCYVVCRTIVNCVQCAQEIHLMKGKAQEQPHQRELHNKLISDTIAIGAASKCGAAVVAMAVAEKVVKVTV